MVQIISIANQKGGVGKTTTSVNLSAVLASMGKNVLLIDCDSQANATTGMGIDKPSLQYSLYQGLIEKVEPDKIIYPTVLPKLKIIPATMDLVGFEFEIVSEKARERKLKNLIDPIKDQFDYIIIDCPPALGLLTLNAFTASDAVLIPLQSEFYALEGLGQLLDTIKRVKSSFNSGLRVKGILLTMYDARTNLSRQVVEEAQKYFSEMLFKTKIPRNVKLSEAPSYGLPVILYDKTSSGAKNYKTFAKEFLER